MGRIRLSVKEREKETERQQIPGKTNILPYSFLLLEEAPPYVFRLVVLQVDTQK